MNWVVLLLEVRKKVRQERKPFDSDSHVVVHPEEWESNSEGSKKVDPAWEASLSPSFARRSLTVTCVRMLDASHIHLPYPESGRHVQ